MHFATSPLSTNDDLTTTTFMQNVTNVLFNSIVCLSLAGFFFWVLGYGIAFGTDADGKQGHQPIKDELLCSALLLGGLLSTRMHGLLGVRWQLILSALSSLTCHDSLLTI